MEQTTMFFDPVYKMVVDIPRRFWPITQASQVQRLAGVRMNGFGRTDKNQAVDSRLTHSLGTALIVGRAMVQALDLDHDLTDHILLALLIHDVGQTPHPHVDEWVLQRNYGLCHHQRGIQMIQTGPLGELIERSGFNRSFIIGLLNGNCQPWAELVNGSLDADSLDNVLRWWHCWQRDDPIPSLFYDPRSIARAYALFDGQLVLTGHIADEVIAYRTCRRWIYERIQGPAVMGRELLFHRLLDTVDQIEGFLNMEYFDLTADAAEARLEEVASPTVHLLRKRLKAGVRYNRLLTYSTNRPSRRFLELVAAQNTSERFLLADWLADHYGLPNYDLVIAWGERACSKPITLPLVDDELPPDVRTPKREWFCDLYVRGGLSPRLRRDIFNTAKAWLEAVDSA